VNSYQLPVTSEQLPVTSEQLPVTSEQLPVNSYQLPIQNPKSKIQNPLVEVGKPGAPLLEQLAQFVEIRKELTEKQQERQKIAPINQISELQGIVTGKVKLVSSPQIGTQIAFDVTGRDWQWGNLAWDSIEARGNFQQGTLTLEPLKIQTGESLLAFSGNLGGMTQAGKLQLTNIPFHQITEFAALPPSLNVGGWLNGTLTLGGSRQNPLVKGEWAVENANINQTLLQQTQGQFLYKNARLFLSASSFLAGEKQPLTLQGSLPYQFPFATVAPDSERFGFSLKARNGSLALLNAFTNNNLNWVSGNGEVNLDIFGTFDSVRGVQKLQADGVATVENGTIALRASPQDPLTAVNGKIRFDFDHIDVEQLTGNFKGGKVAIAGSLPLTQATPQAEPLNLSFDNSDFSLAGHYRGGVRAQVQVTGTALKPQISGQIALFQGVLRLEDALAGRVKPKQLETSRDSGVQFAGLNLILEDNIQVALSPILNFAAAGSLTVNGSLNAPQPQGTVRLNGGYVNVFATLLRLSGADNRVEFSPEHGLDPYLNLELAASTAETTANRAPTDPLSAEIQDPFAANTDSLRTVRIQAKIQGFASQLQDSIELTSSPARSEREILALLGGNVVNTLNALGEEGTVVGLSNLASSAVFGPVQGAIGNALGLTEFRIFTTPLINEQERIGNTQIGVAAEASANLTDDLSLSFLKILNTDRPPQVGLRYRLGDNWIIRGTSNFSDEGRATIEYEQRF
jgi:translocation and assembly module TamB